MYSFIPFRTGDEKALANEFIQMTNRERLKFEVEKLKDPASLKEDSILAVHFADGGAQGDPGAVEILYCLPRKSVQILYGNYAYGDLDLNAVLLKIPALKCFDSRNSFELPYPFGGKLHMDGDWKYLYMGAMNHFIIREDVLYRTYTFIKTLLDDGRPWDVFDALAWFCGAQYTS